MFINNLNDITSSPKFVRLNFILYKFSILFVFVMVSPEYRSLFITIIKTNVFDNHPCFTLPIQLSQLDDDIMSKLIFYMFYIITTIVFLKVGI